MSSLTESFKKMIQGGDSGDGNSAKYFSMVISVLVGLITGLCVCFVLVYDVITNGYIKTDLIDLGLFSLCVGGYITGSSMAEILGEKYKRKVEEKVNQRLGEKSNTTEKKE